jgi:hypothetical protein
MKLLAILFLSVFFNQSALGDPAGCRKLLLTIAMQSYATKWVSRSLNLSNEEMIKVLSAEPAQSKVLFSISLSTADDINFRSLTGLITAAEKYGLAHIPELSSQWIPPLNLQDKEQQGIMTHFIFSGTAEMTKKFVEQLKVPSELSVTFKTVWLAPRASQILAYKARTLSDLNLVPHISTSEFFERTYPLLGPDGKVSLTFENPIAVIERQGAPVMVALNPIYVQMNEVAAINEKLVQVLKLQPNEKLDPAVVENLDHFRSTPRERRDLNDYYALPVELFKDTRFSEAEIQMGFETSSKVGIVFHNEKYGRNNFFLILIPVHIIRSPIEIQPVELGSAKRPIPEARPSKNIEIDSATLKGMLFKKLDPKIKTYISSNVDFLKDLTQELAQTPDKIPSVSKLLLKFMQGKIVPEEVGSSDQVLSITDPKVQTSIYFMLGKKQHIVVVAIMGSKTGAKGVRTKSLISKARLEFPRLLK